MKHQSRRLFRPIATFVFCHMIWGRNHTETSVKNTYPRPDISMKSIPITRQEKIKSGRACIFSLFLIICELQIHQILTKTMKSYFIRQDNKPKGPYSIDQLREMKLNPAVLVWVEGLKQWIKALEIPELQQELFPPAPQAGTHISPSGINTGRLRSQKRGFVFLKNLKTILAVMALIIATLLLIELKKSNPRSATVRNLNSPTGTAITQSTVSQATKTISQPKKDERQLEIENPPAYIKSEINWRKNLLGTVVLEGTLRSVATAATFKNPVLLVTWLSKSNENLGTSQYTVDKQLKAGETISFKLKVSPPSKIGDAKATVVSATAVQ